MKAVAGSHLFGTNTPSSDKDYKGIYIPEKRDLFLGKAKATINIKRAKEHGEKNTSEDVDLELFSLQKFMNMLYEGQTVALELLFTPDEMIIEQSYLWPEIRDLGRKIWVHKKVTSFVGYCKTQADKYGVKGSRMAAVKSAIEELECLVRDCPIDGSFKLFDVWGCLKNNLRELEHIKFGVQETQHGNIPYMEVCERKYQDNQTIGNALTVLNKLYDSYGARAKQAENNEGIDWKACSHALRVCFQAIELLRDGKITLPLKSSELALVRDAKLGLIPFKDFQPILEEKLAEVLQWEKDSTLPEGFDYTEWCEDFVFNTYYLETL